MAFTTTDDGVRLYYEEQGSGTPIVFIHEFAGDHRSWPHQMRYFSRGYRCATYGARGYPPSAVPEDPAAYGQHRAADDAVAILDALGAEKAFFVGNSMGGFAALHVGLRHPDRVLGIVSSGCGYGAHPDKQDGFRAESETIAQAFENEGAEAMSEWYGVGPARVQYQAKDPRGHAEHVRVLAEHSNLGASLTMRAVQKSRPSLYDLRDQLAAMSLPLLVIAGDEDDGVLDTDLMLKRTVPRCGLAVLPRSGHVTNLEEPELYNRLLESFFTQVEHGGWGPRDPRSISGSTTGAK
ncbi:alpha/beta fold hydrolase [Cumulibacter manganitolerans]|uniref:alpha/beta fold hydrolase n=1 Tax=Cumulibacter manganitolerans TaxID=1884992 RepID=UPI0012977A69|nr:alpha/beta hydrolase [Cumulibacter manganitolerans]